MDEGYSLNVTEQLKIEINRNVDIKMYRFTDYFRGFEKVDAVRRIFGDKTEEVLDTLKVEFPGNRGYMGVSDVDGHLIVSAYYLRRGNLVDLYLDIIHELVHVRQFKEGKKLFDTDFAYIARPTEVEAYRTAVDEARRIGLSDEQICEYLRTEWMGEKDFIRLASSMNVNVNCKRKPETK